MAEIYKYGPATSASLRFYGPNYHASAPVAQRVRSSGLMGPVPFVVVANALVDNYFTLWYRRNGGPWIFIAEVVEGQNSYGAASISYALTLDIGVNDYIDFGVAPLNSALEVYNESKRSLQYLTMWVMAINL